MKRISKRTGFAAPIAALALFFAAEATGQARPAFQYPGWCGEVWAISTYPGHGPDEDSLDGTIWTEDRVNVGLGEPVLAMADATVIRSDENTNGSLRIYLEHAGGWVTHYVHNQPNPAGQIAVGRRVAAGEVIAWTGQSGADQVHQHIAQIDPSGDGVRQVFDGDAVETRQADRTTWGRWGQLDAEEVLSANCPNGQFLIWREQDELFILTYKHGDGAAEIYRLLDDKVSAPLWSGAMMKRATHFAHFQIGDAHHVIAYRASDGAASMSRLLPRGSGVLEENRLSLWGRWTEVNTFELGGGVFAQFYSSLHGELSVLAIDNDGKGLSPFVDVEFDFGFTSLGTMPDTRGPTYFGMKGSTGEAVVIEMQRRGEDVDLKKIPLGVVGAGWSTLTPFILNGARHVFGYSATRKEAQIWSVERNPARLVPRDPFGMEGGFTSFNFWVDPEGGARLLAYKIKTGEMAFFEVDPQGASLTRVAEGSFKRGRR